MSDWDSGYIGVYIYLNSWNCILKICVWKGLCINYTQNCFFLKAMLGIKGEITELNLSNGSGSKEYLRDTCKALMLQFNKIY